MGGIYVNGTTPGYPSLLDVIAGTGLELHVWDGWEWNTRSSGGFDKLLGVIAHHTASPPTMSFQNDWAYCAQGHPDSPVASVLLGRQGQVGLHSGGAANHAGKSEQPWVASKGTVPVSAGNSNLIGIEAANNGVGEPWSAQMLDAYERLVAALCSAYGFDPARDVPSHALAGPGYTNRKIDPWGPAGGGDFPYTGSRTWVMQGPNSFTDRVRQRMSGGGPTPPPEDDDMKPYLVQFPDVPSAPVLVCDGTYQTLRWIRDAGSLERIQNDMIAKGADPKINVLATFQIEDQGVLIGEVPPGWPADMPVQSDAAGRIG